MQSIEVTVKEQRCVDRLHHIIEQGVPVRNIAKTEVGKLGIFDESDVPVPAGIEIESTDPNGDVKWLTVSLPVSMQTGEEKRFTIKESVTGYR